MRLAVTIGAVMLYATACTGNQAPPAKTPAPTGPLAGQALVDALNGRTNPRNPECQDEPVDGITWTQRHTITEPIPIREGATVRVVRRDGVVALDIDGERHQADDAAMRVALSTSCRYRLRRVPPNVALLVIDGERVTTLRAGMEFIVTGTVVRGGSVMVILLTATNPPTLIGTLPKTQLRIGE